MDVRKNRNLQEVTIEHRPPQLRDAPASQHHGTVANSPYKWTFSTHMRHMPLLAASQISQTGTLDVS